MTVCNGILRIGCATGRFVASAKQMPAWRRMMCGSENCAMTSVTRFTQRHSGWRAGGAVLAGGGLLITRPFVLPYKRFATPCLVTRAQEYLAPAADPKKRPSYRQSVRHGRCLIGYPVEPSGHQPVMAHSLVYRFVIWLGGLTASLQKAQAMILERNPDSTCHRRLSAVDPSRAHSPPRLQTLETARQLLLTIPEWEACFACPFFPRFAARSGFD